MPMSTGTGMAVEGGAGLLSSIFGKNQGRQEANSAMSNFNNLAQFITGQINQISPGVVSGLQHEAQYGLDPNYTANMFSRYDIGQEHDLNNIVSRLGSALPNLAGSVRDFGENALTGRVQLGQGLAAENQQFEDSALRELAGIMGGYQADLPGLMNSYLGLAGQGAQMAGQNNPFNFISSFLANNPGIFSRGSTGAGPQQLPPGGLGGTDMPAGSFPFPMGPSGQSMNTGLFTPHVSASPQFSPFPGP